MTIGKNLTMGIDIGGAHITVGLVDMDKRTVSAASVIRNKVNNHGTSDEILAAWAGTINAVQTKGFSTIGFAMPGPFDYENGICLIKGLNKYESLYGMNIRNEMASRTTIAPENIRFRNNAEAFLEGEIFCGAARGYQHVIGVTLGTGLGSAISHNGVTKDGELNVMEYEGEKIEEWVSIRGLIRIYKDLTGITAPDARTIANLAKRNQQAKEAFTIFAHHLSWFLKEFILRESPEVLVIGGNMSYAYDLFMEEVKKVLSDSGVLLPKIVKASLGANAGLIGGACSFKLPSVPVEK